MKNLVNTTRQWWGLLRNWRFYTTSYLGKEFQRLFTFFEWINSNTDSRLVSHKNTMLGLDSELDFSIFYNPTHRIRNNFETSSRIFKWRNGKIESQITFNHVSVPQHWQDFETELNFWILILIQPCNDSKMSGRSRGLKNSSDSGNWTHNVCSYPGRSKHGTNSWWW